MAMLGVVMAHSSADILITKSFSNYWNLANAIIVIVTPAVPLFFMISGATILNSKKTYSVGYLFKHRLTRVLIPFVFWSFVSTAFFQHIDPNTGFSWSLTLKNMSLIYHQPVLEAYWFIYPLIAFYLISPLIKALVDNMNDQLLNYALILWFITNMILPFLVVTMPSQWANIFKVDSFGNLFFISKSLGYFILGYKLSKVDTKKLHLSLNLILSIVLIAVMIGINYWTYHDSSVHIPVTGYEPSVFVPVISSLIFLSFKIIDPKIPLFMGKVIEFIAPLTYGVYLVHGIGIRLAQYYVSNLNFLGVFALATVISLVIVWIISLIPIAKKYLI
ncbi:acyltransferase 3 [Companilactobacillus tucceti DSM 20183]|uniref:Acyltransferase 3 n=1 Tax=Companilactobacillus tucceti DSM 20183 TaxID=1423811 RepID=A0A0R1J9U1_9LACO|nr:acyltransferase 3 [Companilactobacillus tucceti DSM 20183]